MLTVKVADLRRFSPDSPCPLCHGKALAVFCAPGTEIQQIHADCTPGDVQTLGRNPEAKLSVDAPHMHRHCETCGYHWLESIVSLPERLGGFLGDNPKLSTRIWGVPSAVHNR